MILAIAHGLGILCVLGSRFIRFALSRTTPGGEVFAVSGDVSSRFFAMVVLAAVAIVVVITILRMSRR
jgi:hypothetical protein